MMTTLRHSARYVRWNLLLVVLASPGQATAAIPRSTQPATASPDGGRIWLYVKAGAKDDNNPPWIPSGSKLRSGDIIKIELESERDGYLYLAQQDAAGALTMLNRDAPLQITPGITLRKSLALDDGIGKEQLFYWSRLSR